MHDAGMKFAARSEPFNLKKTRQLLPISCRFITLWKKMYEVWIVIVAGSYAFVVPPNLGANNCQPSIMISEPPHFPFYSVKSVISTRHAAA